MFRKPKIPKREAPDQGWYTLLNYDKLKRPEWLSGNGPEYYCVASLDPSRDNFGFRIEKWYASGLNKGRVIMVDFLKVGFKAQDPTNSNLTFSRITSFILSKIQSLILCHYIISERQMPINHQAVRISTHALSLIMLLTEGKGNKPIVMEIHPQLKYRQLDAPKGWTERQLKTIWTPQKAIEILTERGDKESVEVIEKSKKKDDFGDIVNQVEALNKLLELFPKNPTVKLKILAPCKSGNMVDTCSNNTATLPTFVESVASIMPAEVSKDQKRTVKLRIISTKESSGILK